MNLAYAVTPNRVVSPAALRWLGLAWLAGLVAAWSASSFDVLPTPLEVMRAFRPLAEQSLLPHLFASMRTNAVAMLWATAISLGLAYASVLPVVKPVAAFVAKTRFWGFTGITVLFTLWFRGGHQLKISLLVFGLTGFFVTAMIDEVQAIPQEKFDYARTLGMGEARVVWEVIVRGTLDRAFDVFRQNAAMGWMLLTMVETLVRSEGGIGVLLANQNKHMNLASVVALQSIVFGVGMGQDYLIGVAKNLVCPHAELEIARR
jgi:NitT/TauT family transport system permease protein